ncbi:hypothetical protein OSTOST_21292, partial [Ostertagia ostertagi]
MGINGLAFWSSSTNMTTRCDLIKDFVNTTLGPAILNYTETCSSFTVNESGNDQVANCTLYGTHNQLLSNP